MTKQDSKSFIQRENLLTQDDWKLRWFRHQRLKGGPGFRLGVYPWETRTSDEAAQAYRIGVRHIAWDRLSQEERVEETHEALQRWESKGTPNSMHIPNHRPPTSFLHQSSFITNEPFQICPKSLEPSIEHSVILIASCQPQSHLLPSSSVLTRPFRTDPHIYDLATHDESVVVFGVDLQ